MCNTLDGKNDIFILSGGNIHRKLLQQFLQKYPNAGILCVDGGLKIADEENLNINFIVGDFDTIDPEILSKYKKNTNIEIKEYNPVKDNTDTDIALELAISKKPQRIILFGATGTRLDHTLGNFHILHKALKAGIETYIIDLYNKIYMIQSGITLKREMLYGPYVSLIPFSSEVTGVKLQGFRYPLEGKTLHIGESLGISNEVVEDHAVIELEKGILLVIEARDFSQ